MSIFDGNPEWRQPAPELPDIDEKLERELHDARTWQDFIGLVQNHPCMTSDARIELMRIRFGEQADETKIPKRVLKAARLLRPTPLPDTK